MLVRPSIRSNRFTIRNVVYHNLLNYREVFQEMLKSRVFELEDAFLVTGIYLLRTKPEALEWPNHAGRANSVVGSFILKREEFDGHILATDCEKIVGSEKRGVFGLSAGGAVTSFHHPDTDDGYEPRLEMGEYFDEVARED